MSSDTNSPTKAPPQPRPYAVKTLPTPRSVLVDRLGLSQTDAVLAVAGLFNIFVAASVVLNNEIVSRVWVGVGVALFTAAFFVAHRSSEYDSALQDIPKMGDVYLARQYARVSTAISVLTILGMVVVVGLLVVESLGGRGLELSATSETITAVGALTCLVSSYGLVRVLLSHAPPFNQTLLNPLEHSNLPEIIFTIGLVGCPAFVFVAAFLWRRPSLIEFQVTLPTHGVLIVLGGACALYTALVTRL